MVHIVSLPTWIFYFAGVIPMHRRQRQLPNCLRMRGATQKLSAALSYNNSCEEEKEWMRGATHAFVRLCSLFTPPQVLNSLCHVAHKVLAGACDWTEVELYDENPNNPRARVTSSILFRQTTEEALRCSWGDAVKLWTNSVIEKKKVQTNNWNKGVLATRMSLATPKPMSRKLFGNWLFLFVSKSLECTRCNVIWKKLFKPCWIVHFDVVKPLSLFSGLIDQHFISTWRFIHHLPSPGTCFLGWTVMRLLYDSLSVFPLKGQ